MSRLAWVNSTAGTDPDFIIQPFTPVVIGGVNRRDLSILGREVVAFDAYDANIRREYDWVPEETYRRERARILSGFLTRQPLFHTEFCRDRFEKRARENLRRAIEKLQA